MAKNGKLPKRIAGVKIPKKLRKQGAPLYSLLNQPMVRNVVADLVAVGLLAAADAMAKEPPVRKAGKAAKRAAASAGKATKHSAEDAAEAAGASAVQIRNFLALAAREAAQAIKSR